MSLTAMQTQILLSHLSALRAAITQENFPDSGQKITVQEVCGSLVNELGHTLPTILVAAIAHAKPARLAISATAYENLLDLLDQAEDQLNMDIDSDTPPAGKFRDILAKLFEELAPIILQILLGFLTEPDAKKTKSLKLSR